MTVKIYVEGGGDQRESKVRCRKGFSAFLRKTRLSEQMPRVISCGGRQTAYDKFRTALAKAGDNDFIVLLVDSEGSVTDGPWAHLKSRDDWDRPEGATDENVHLMVQVMETWFLADKENLAEYFGSGFNKNALPARTDVENIAKTDVLDGLKKATRSCATKAQYNKGRHSFDILARIVPGKVTAASPYAGRLVSTLIDRASSQ